MRLATPEDDLSTVYDATVVALPWNREQVVVAVREGQVIGAVIFWDAGHPVVFLENWVIATHERKRLVWYRMARALETLMRARGKVALMGMAPDPGYLAMVQRYGAEVNPAPYYVITRVLPWA